MSEFFTLSNGTSLAEQHRAEVVEIQTGRGLTTPEAHAPLEAFPCCFLHNKGGTIYRGGKPVEANGKEPAGTAWPKNPKTPKQYSGQGVGVICGPLPGRDDDAQLGALDFDIPHDKPAQAAREWLSAWIKDKGKQGEAMVRVGLPPKFLVPFLLKD